MLNTFRKIQTLILISLSFISLITKITCNKNLPLIGILAVPETGIDKTSKNYVVNANYVRWLEASGLETIALLPWEDELSQLNILEKINGVLIQGEDVNFDHNSPYYKSVKLMVDKIRLFKNTKKFNIPLLGIGSGFQILQNILAEVDVVTSHFHVNSKSSLIFFKDEIIDTRMFQNVDDNFLDILKNHKVIYQNHNLAVGVHKYSEKNKLKDYMYITSTDKDDKGEFYVCTAEGVSGYPFYGLQFHPEKISFNKNFNFNVPDSLESVIVSQYFANFLLKKALENSNTLEDYRNYAYYLTDKLSDVANETGDYYYKFQKNIKP